MYFCSYDCKVGEVARELGVFSPKQVMNLNNSDTRTHTLPSQHRAPAVKQKLRNDGECSHCAPCG